ncbi:unnamed protein product [Cuscuta campestris]|uniref:Uncharacterized protein n=1 Tax=Cuscuta campestris TaxID=132261 RepID=A0A484LY31_9ASTE|nr:unnamed protein product [Cuscuta campestris]
MNMSSSSTSGHKVTRVVKSRSHHNCTTRICPCPYLASEQVKHQTGLNQGLLRIHRLCGIETLEFKAQQWFHKLLF